MESSKRRLYFLLGVVLVLLESTIAEESSDRIIKIIYRLSAKNLPEGRYVFAEVDKGRSFYCRTESIRSENPDWNEICEVKFRPSATGENITRLIVETRHNRSGPDESIGWSAFLVRDMLQNGNVIEDEIRNDGVAYGTMTLTVLLACVLGEPQCGLPMEKHPLPKPLFSLKIYV